MGASLAAAVTFPWNRAWRVGSRERARFGPNRPISKMSGCSLSMSLALEDDADLRPAGLRAGASEVGGIVSVGALADDLVSRQPFQSVANVVGTEVGAERAVQVVPQDVHRDTLVAPV